jgi:beta-glucosidase
MKLKLFQLTFVLFLLCSLITSSCKTSGEKETAKKTYDQPWQDPSLSIDDRVADLLSRMTLEEKISQMVYNSPAIERLGITPYNWWSECLHGVARSGRATVYPQAIGLAATFDTNLIFRIGTAISDEGRAMFHAATAKGFYRQYGGLTFWTPNINIFRDPRWGRGQETYGEDPYLTGQIGTALVRGIQGDHPTYLKAGACAKHYAVHSGPEGLRHEFNAVASKKDLYETYLPAFKALVDAGVEAVMCAYNRTNDEACCGSNTLLQEILRKEWDFRGHIVSDCWALHDLYEGHKVSANRVEAAALALKNGVNVNCGDTYPYLADAVEQGLISEADIDEALSWLLRSRFKLGLFDPPEMNPYTSISTDVINCDKHRQLAREAAQKSIVLLKNENNVLPLKKDIEYIYVLGPNATNLDVLLGNYYGLSGNMSTILEGLTAKVEPGSFIAYRQGCLLDRDNINPIDWTTDGAKQATVSIAVMGISGLLEGEEGESILSPTKGDRFDIRLPANQVNQLKKLRQNNHNPIILILTGGSPIDISEVEDLADAILFVWYPGEEGGNAVADIIFGDISPSGRLPITFPKSLDQLPSYDDYSMTGRTYRYMTKEPMYPFGFGKSFTSFEYQDGRIDREVVKAGQSVNVEVTVKNTGEIEADEVIQLYITDLNATVTVPLYSLKEFKRIHLKPGESIQVDFNITPEMMQIINNDGESVLEPGEFKITIGGSSPGKRSVELGAPTPVEVLFRVEE